MFLFIGVILLEFGELYLYQSCLFEKIMNVYANNMKFKLYIYADKYSLKIMDELNLIDLE